MKTRIKCVETRVNGVLSKTYHAQVRGLVYINCLRGCYALSWQPVAKVYRELSNEFDWMSAEETTVHLGGHPLRSEARAKALIDRFRAYVTHQRASHLEFKERERQKKVSKKVTYEGYPEDQ